MRGASTHWRKRAAAVVRELNQRDDEPELGKARLLQTRQEVLRGWRAVGDDLVLQHQLQLAQAVRRFVGDMPAVQTEKEWIMNRLLERQKARNEPGLSR